MADECAPAGRCRATREDDVHVEWVARVRAQPLIEGDVIFIIVVQRNSPFGLAASGTRI
jgi:hypothetical protein